VPPGASSSFDRVRTYDQGIEQELGTSHDRRIKTSEPVTQVQAVAARRNDALKKNAKRYATVRQTADDIEEAMGEGGGDDDEEGDLRTKMRMWRGLDLQATG